jgi:hypothetical protein
MGNSFHISLQGMVEVKKRLKNVSEYLGNLRQEMEETSRDIDEMIDGNFEAGASGRSRWPSLSKATRGMRSAGVGYYSTPGRSGSSPTSKLVWTGQLRRDITGKGRRSVLRIRQRGKGVTEMVKGTNNPLASLHHSGSSHQRPAISKGAGGLTFISSSGSVVFAQGVGPAAITIPARPLYTEAQLVRGPMFAMKERIGNRTVAIWGGHLG